ncbi:hypothetical protein [Halomarina litorea]|uniref:hypothetical protein n=1 Tax=Halomarina litorea TaxID=2961595 RepID=UPI0020C5A426|nr:hypothetical protein [Halomarina sp. BCD28]
MENPLVAAGALVTVAGLSLLVAGPLGLVFVGVLFLVAGVVGAKEGDGGTVGSGGDAAKTNCPHCGARNDADADACHHCEEGL